jgi:hypothetical protein
MPSEPRIVDHLRELARLLSESGDSYRFGLVQAAIAGDDADRDVFLTSNALWGGPGSIADEGGITTGRTATRRRIESVLVAIGEEQLRSSAVNQRTAMWVAAFKKWAKDGI